MRAGSRLDNHLWILRLILPLFVLIIIYVAFAIRFEQRSCDISGFSPERAIEHAKVLSSPDMEGRGLGTEGNRKSVDYLESAVSELGLIPAIDGRFLQDFPIVSPTIDNRPVFNIRDQDSGILAEFSMYQDYRLVPSGRGAGIDFNGEIVLVGHNMFKIPPEALSGRVVLIESWEMTDRKLDYAFKQGCAGIIFSAAKTWTEGRLRAIQEEKILNTEGKQAADMMIGTIGIDAYKKLRDIAGEEDLFSQDRPYAVIDGVELKVTMAFPVTTASSVLAYVPGIDGSRTLILSSNIDGKGTGTGEDYFPGAGNSALSSGILLEIARVLVSEETKPKYNILFAFWNAGQQDSAGMKYYLSEAPFPLQNTVLMHIGALGTAEESYITTIAADNHLGNIYRSKLMRYGRDAGSPVGGLFRVGTDAVTPFLRDRIPSLVFSVVEPEPDTYSDLPEKIVPGEVNSSAHIILNYLKRDVYGDVAVDYLSAGQILFFCIVLFWLILAYLLSTLHSLNPTGSLGRVSVEALYFNPVLEIIRKGAAVFITVALVFFFIVLVVSLPRDGTLIQFNDRIVTNHSIYLSLKESLQVIDRILFSQNLDPRRRQKLMEALLPAWGRTMGLTTTAMFLALTIGSVSGIREAYGRKSVSDLRAIGSLAMASIPDVAVAIAGIWTFLLVARFSPELGARLALKQFTLPAIALAVLPAAYVSRISNIIVCREMDREYTWLAKARGLSRRQILFHELMPAIISGIADTLPTLAAMMLTNLIVIEYMFGFRGIVNYLLLFHTRGDAGGFVIGAVSTGLIYVIFTFIGRLIAGLVHPDRKVVAL